MSESSYFDKLAIGRNKWISKNKYYYRFIEKVVRFFVDDESSVLEVGCGTGNLIDSLNNRVKVGIDFSREMVRIAKKGGSRKNFFVFDIEKKTIKKRFDWILAVNLVGYLNDIYLAFNKIKLNCNPQTRVLVVYYNHLWEPLLKLAEKMGMRSPQPEQNWLGISDLKNIFDLLGFEVIRVDFKILFPIDVPLLSSFTNNFLASLPIVRNFSLTQIMILRLKETKRKDYSVSIIVPARNEEKNISRLVRLMPRFGKKQEIVFVEGHSKDKTWDEIQRASRISTNRLSIRAFRQKGIGKADAVRLGFEKAKGKLLMILDADLTVMPIELVKFYEAMATGKGEFINGSRLIYPMEKQAMRFLNKIGNKLFSLAFTFILGQPFKDTLCGTKVILKRDYERIARARKYFGEFDPFGDFDLIFGAVKQSLKIVEVPVRYGERTYGSTNISRFRHGLLLFKMTWFAFIKLMFV